MKNNVKIIAIAVVVIMVAVIFVGVEHYDKKDDGKISIVQSNDEIITVDGQFERIIATGTYVAEALYVIGAVDKIVGVSDSILKSAEYSGMFTNIASVGSWTEPSIDTIYQLNADCIIVYTSASTTNLDALIATGIVVIQIDCADYERIPNEVRSLGAITGCSEKANDVAELLENVSDTINSNNNLTNNSAFIESFSSTTNNACGLDSSVTAAWLLAGGDTIIKEAGNSLTVQTSAIIAGNPDYIIKRISTAAWTSTDKEVLLQSIADRAGFDSISAVENGDLYAISNSAVGGIRSFIGVIIFANLINPGSTGNLTIESCMAEYNAIGSTNFTTDVFYAYVGS